MTYSNHRKMLKQLRGKPAAMSKFKKYNTPKKRLGISTKRCTRCGRIRAHISSFGLHLCRQCFREIATSIGFKKYN